MKKGMFVLLGALFTLAPFGEVAAQQLRPWEISIAGGPSFARGDFGAEANTGFHVQGSVGFGLPLFPMGLRADLLWQELPVTGVDGEWFRQIGGLLNGTFGLPLAVIEPYGLVGVGFLRNEEPAIQHGGHVHTGGTENLIGFNAGLGLDFPFMGLTGFLEGRFLNLFGTGEATHFQTIPVSIGIRF
jgi:hypothetical protein